MTSPRSASWLAIGAAIVAPCAVAAAMVPVRSSIDNANAALVLAAVVVAVAMFGRRFAVVVAAVSAMLWFDFFHTVPYQSFAVESRDDIVTAVVLLIVGLLAGELAIRARRHRAAAAQSRDEIDRIQRIAQMVALGESPDFVMMAVADELRDMLSLRDCRFERGTEFFDPKPLARLERTGDAVLGSLSWPVQSVGFPTGEVVLLVQGGGRTYGRFLLGRTIAAPVSLERRVVAVALADQVGAAFAARSPGGGTTHSSVYLES